MAFPNQIPLEFDRINIESLNPNQFGCYGIVNHGGTMVYIGKGDIRARLLEHYNTDNTCIKRNLPTHYVTALSDNPDRLEKSLILEYNPVCNKKVG
jgi:hypothetical protein